MFINESFLSFVWQYAYFNLSGLSTPGGQQLEIIFPGNLNRHAGPDFNDARIRIDGILWMGAVEIHIRSSQWNLHRHQTDENYNRVVLHVVWEHDSPAFRADGSEIPVLELHSRVSEELINRFRSLVYVTADKVACQSQLNRILPVKINNMIQKALIQRLQRKSYAIDHLLDEHHNDWEEVSYRWLVRNFGFKVNQENMFLLAKFLPHVLILRHRNNLLRLEALLFGMAGFLEDERDEYQTRLKEEYVFLKHKYKLDGDFLKRHQWKFLRLHPQNFPTVRIAQLAVFLTRISDFFSYVIHSGGIKTIYEDFKVIQSFYWQHNYDFGVPSKRKVSGLGASSIDNILINSFVPLLVAYGRYTDQLLYQEKALALLEGIRPENNRITRQWKTIGLDCRTAADSQGLIELYTRFCYKKQCLSCNIGAEIMLNLN